MERHSPPLPQTAGPTLLGQLSLQVQNSNMPGHHQQYPGNHDIDHGICACYHEHHGVDTDRHIIVCETKQKLHRTDAGKVLDS